MIYGCANCTALHEAGSDEYRSLCSSCWHMGWRLDTLGNVIAPAGRSIAERGAQLASDYDRDTPVLLDRAGQFPRDPK